MKLPAFSKPCGRCQFSALRTGALAGLASLLCLWLPAWSQQPRFERRTLPVVVPASALITEASGKAYAIGEALEMTRRPTEAAARLRASGLQARIFAVDRRGAEPHAHAILDDCLVYFSSVIPIAANRESAIHLGALHEAWLTVQRGRPPDDGRFLLVFERAGDGRQLFRLEKANSPGYFRTGFYFEVRAPSPSTFSDGQKKFDALADTNAAAWVIREKAAREMTDSKGAALPCYRFQAMQMAGGGQELAYLDDCASGDPAL